MGNRTPTFQQLRDSLSLEFGDGYRAKNEELGGKGPVFLRAAYLQDNGFNLRDPDRFNIASFESFGSKVARLGDVVITTKGNSTGRVGFIRREQVGSVYSPHLSYWRSLSPDILDQKFLYFWSLSPEFRSQLHGLAYSTDMAPYLSLRDQARLRITLPSINNQQSISELLGALDDKIELNRQTNETLEALARALFNDWFVDFGPTRAKAEGRPPYLAPELWDCFPDALDDEDKPVGWEFGTVGECFQLTMGQSPPGNTYNDQGEGLPFFQGRTDFGFRYPENRKYCTAPTRIAEEDDTLISVRAPVGDINMAWDKCCVGRGVSALRHNTGSVSFTYYSAWSIQQQLQQYEHTGTVFGAINKKQFEGLQTIEPPLNLVTSFDEYVGPIDRRIRGNIAENRTLAETRDLLLPKLMSGEICLKDAETFVGEVA